MVILLSSLLLLALTEAAVCPVYSCSSEIPDDLCGTRIDYQTFQLNENGCSGSHECSVHTFSAWTWSSESIAFSCAAVLDPFPKAGNWTAFMCPPVQENKGFKNYAQNLTCYSDEDCELQDGSYAECVCVYRNDGLGVCKPDPSDTVTFAGYWSECKANHGYIKDQKAYMYWTWYVQNWVWTQSNVECVSMFWEMDKLQYLQGEYESAVGVTLGAVALLVGFF